MAEQQPPEYDYALEKQLMKLILGIQLCVFLFSVYGHDLACSFRQMLAGRSVRANPLFGIWTNQRETVAFLADGSLRLGGKPPPRKDSLPDVAAEANRSLTRGGTQMGTYCVVDTDHVYLRASGATGTKRFSVSGDQLMLQDEGQAPIAYQRTDMFISRPPG